MPDKVEMYLDELGDTIHLYYRPHGVIADVARAKVKLAVRDLMLAVLDEAIVAHATGISYYIDLAVDELRARLEAVGRGKEPRPEEGEDDG